MTSPFCTGVAVVAPTSDASLFDPLVPSGPPTLISSAGNRVWRLDPDWFIVELERPAELRPEWGQNCRPRCVSVVVDMQGVIHCACLSGRRRIGCAHILAAGQLLDQTA